MPRTAQTQAGFTAGELSPRVRGRTDLARYKSGLQKCENWLPMRQGPLVRRPGFRFVVETKDSTRKSRLIPFEFNDEQTYILEFGAKDSASFTIGTADTSADAFTIATTDATDTFRASRTFTVSGSTGNDGTYTTIASQYDGTDTLVFVTTIADSTADGTIVADIGYIRFFRDEGQLESSADVATEIDSPYDELDLANVKYTQSNDIIFFAHPDYHPFKLSRTSGADNLVATWTMDEETTDDGPYLDENITATEMKVATGVTGVTELVTSTVAIFVQTDVGRSIRMRDGNNAGWMIITEFLTTTTVNALIKSTVPAAAIDPNTVAEWRLGAFSITTGYPAVVSFFDGRLWWAATATEISTLFASTLALRTNYAPTGLAAATTTATDSGLVVQISDSQQNPIRWLFSDQRGMLILTSGGLHLLTNNAAGDAITGLELGLSLRKQNNDPVSSLVSPQRSGTFLLVPDTGERRTLQQVFTFQDERVIGTDLNILADHISVGGTVESAFQDRPDRRFWMARADGQLVCLLYDPEQQVVAWSRHILGGSFSGEKQPVVESIASITETNEDQLWAIVKRSINGTKRYVEFMENLFDVDTELEDAFFVDSGLTLNDNKAITGASNSNPVVITAVGHGFSDGNNIRIRNMKGLTKTTVNDDNSVTVTDPINNITFAIGSVTTDTFTLLGLDGTALDGYVSDGDANLEVSTVTAAHLAGQTVNVMVDGANHPQALADSAGAITLDKAASLVHVGLPVVSQMQTMPVVDTTGDRDSRSGIIQINQIFLLVDRSLGGAIGTATGEYNELIYREADNAMGEALPLFTGFLDEGF